MQDDLSDMPEGWANRHPGLAYVQRSDRASAHWWSRGVGFLWGLAVGFLLAEVLYAYSGVCP